MENKDLSQAFFKESILLISKLISTFFIFSFVFGILFINSSNKLGYFIESQAIICLSIFIVFLYLKKILQIEKKYEISE